MLPHGQATFVHHASGREHERPEPAVGPHGCRLRTDLRLSGKASHLHQPVDIDVTIISAFKGSDVRRPTRVQPADARQDALEQLLKPLDEAYKRKQRKYQQLVPHAFRPLVFSTGGMMHPASNTMWLHWENNIPAFSFFVSLLSITLLRFRARPYN